MDNGNSVVEVQPSVSERRDLSLLKRIPLTKDYAPRIEWLWDHLKRCDYAFDDFSRGSSQVWMNKLVRPNSEHYEFGDDGYCMVDEIVPSLNANVHFAVWGKERVPEILSAGKELFDYLFTEYKLNRITAMVPVNNRQACRLAILMRFKFEGEIRKIFLFHGRYYNLTIYGLLRDEYYKKEVTQ